MIADAALPCPMCGAQGYMLEQGVDDVYFGYPGQWRLDRCSAADCAIVWIANRLPDDQLAASYARYYTHQARPPGVLETAFGRWIARRCATHGDRFAAVPFLFREAENRLIDMGAVPPQGDALVLDLGCGSGERLDYLRAIGWGRSEGVDPDPTSVARGVATGRRIRTGSAEQIPFADNAAALVLMHHVVEHLADIRPALAEVSRVLCDQGHVAITTPNPDAAGRERWGRWWRGYEAPRHLRLFTQGSLCNALHQAGFAVRIARTSARSVPFMTHAAARASGSPVDPAWIRWWRDDRAILAIDRRIRGGEAIGEEVFVVARKMPR